LSAVSGILENKIVQYVLVLGVLALISTLPFLSGVAAQIIAGVTMGAGFIGLAFLLWLFSSKGPMGGK